MKEMRIAIIGCGMISHRHMTVIENLNKQGYNLKVVAAAEIKKDRLEAWGKKYGLDEQDLYQDFREMLKRDDIDEVEVCVHNNLHTSVATAVMVAGFRVIQKSQWQLVMRMQKFFMMHRRSTVRNLRFRLVPFIIRRRVLQRK